MSSNDGDVGDEGGEDGLDFLGQNLAEMLGSEELEGLEFREALIDTGDPIGDVTEHLADRLVIPPANPGRKGSWQGPIQTKGTSASTSDLLHVTATSQSPSPRASPQLADDEAEAMRAMHHDRGQSLPGYAIRGTSPSAGGSSTASASTDSRIADIERQLEIEYKIRSGAESLCRHYSAKKSDDGKAMAEALSTLSRTTRKIEQLTAEMERIKGSSSSADTPRQNQKFGRIGHGKGISFHDLDGDDSESTLTAEDMNARLHRLRDKLQVEVAVKSAAERMARVVGQQLGRAASTSSLGGSSSSPAKAQSKAPPAAASASGDEKNTMADIFKSISSATAKISILTAAIQKYEKQLRVIGSEPDPPQALSPPTTYTGKLTVKLIAAHHLAPVGRALESSVVVKVDSVVRGKTKKAAKSTTPMWNESLAFKLDKNSELEIEVYDGSDMRGLAFFRLEDCMQELTLTGQMTAWFNVEPSGLIQISLSFVREVKAVRRLSQVGRRGAVRKRNAPDKVHMLRGHRFKDTRQLSKCTVCGDFIIRGYTCMDCNCACHVDCANHVNSKCLSSDASSEGGSAAARKPHSFETTFIAIPTFCAHCGAMVPIGRRRAQRCADCHIIAHPKCTTYLPVACKSAAKRMSQDGLSPTSTSPPPVISSSRSFLMNLIKGDRTNSATFLSVERTASSAAKEPSPASTPTTQTSFPPIPEKQGKEESKRESSSPVATSPAAATAAASAPASSAPSAPSGKGGSSQAAMRQKTAAFMSTDQKATRPISVDDFNILKMLGRGNFGKVMLVEHKVTGVLYAMKTLKKEFIIQNDELPSLRSEKLTFMVTSSQPSPFLLKLYGAFQTETRLYFIMEYVAGGDLMNHIQRSPFNYERARFYAIEVLLALEHLHSRDLIYRDLKLDNILLGLDGHIRIADYGLCKALEGVHGLTNTFCGTPEFMAPEILRDEDYGAPVDWWAYGVLLYEMFLAESPFTGDDEEDIFDSILEDEITYPAELPSNVTALLKKLLVKDPKKRLGYTNDAAEIKKHPFFKDVDWAAYANLKVTPPYRPYIVSERDVANFDSSFTSEQPVLTPLQNVLSTHDQEEFKGFSYVSPWQGTK